eukprot:m.255336 g.255336  ORF g.255336 m.255336 type:complete len:240 (+) comp19435_c0_seq1:648-1367(+)
MTTLARKLTAASWDENVLERKESLFITYADTYIDWKFESGLADLRTNAIARFTSTKSPPMLLLRQLGRGADGVAWLARTRSGDVRVLKFMAKESVDRELSFWKICTESDLWVHIAARRFKTKRFARHGFVDALCMPLFYTLKLTERVTYTGPHVIAAIDLMARRGVLHRDMHWRHVGLYRVGSRVGAVIFDHGSSVFDPRPAADLSALMVSALEWSEQNEALVSAVERSEQSKVRESDV